MIAIEAEFGKRVFNVFDVCTKDFDNQADVMEYLQQLEFELLPQKKRVSIAYINNVTIEATHYEYSLIFFKILKSKYINKIRVTYMIVKEDK